MSGKTDEAKGKIKEAAGDLTGDKSLQHEGKKDQAVGKVKQTADKAERKFDEAVDEVNRRLDD